MKNLLHNISNYAVIVSILAMIVAVGGTSFAATKKKTLRNAPQYTSQQVKNSSLTTANIKNESISANNFAKSTIAALKIKGDKGSNGDEGAEGDQGIVGMPGSQGTPAKNAFGWAVNNPTSILSVKSGNNSPPQNWYGFINTPASGWTQPAGQYTSTQLELASSSNDGLLVIERPSVIFATANLTTWHQGTTQSTLECRMMIQDISGAREQIGEPTLVSSKEDMQVITLSLVGSIKRSVGTYGVKVECRDLNFDVAESYKKWRVAKGNLSVLSSNGSGV